jgi:hypothetical protein
VLYPTFPSSGDLDHVGAAVEMYRLQLEKCQ